MDFHQTWYVHWYCGGLFLGLLMDKFCQFWTALPAMTRPYFHFWTISLVNIKGFSPNFLCALILWSGLRLLMDKFCQFLQSYLATTHLHFSFWPITSKSQWIFTIYHMCIDIVKIWFGIAQRQISWILTEIWKGHDNGGVISFHVFIYKGDFVVGRWLGHCSRWKKWAY